MGNHNSYKSLQHNTGTIHNRTWTIADKVAHNIPSRGKKTVFSSLVDAMISINQYYGDLILNEAVRTKNDIGGSPVSMYIPLTL